MIKITKKDKKKFLKKEVDLDTIFDMIIKEHIRKQKPMKQVKSLESMDYMAYCKEVKRFYKKLIEIHKLKHNNKLAGLVCAHLFSLSGMLNLTYGYKKGKNKHLFDEYVYSSIESMSKILVNFTEKEGLISKEEIGKIKLKIVEKNETI